MSSPRSKWWEWYKLVAINGFNTVVFVVAAIVILDLSLDLRRFLRGTVPTYSLEFDLDSYTVIERERAQRVGAEYDRMGENQTFLFNPWSVATVAPFTGNEIFVQKGKSTNVRRTLNSPADSRPDYRIWIFGGSTTFGWGMPDSHTLATLLGQALQRRVPDVRVEVTNYAQPYYFSSVELSMFLALLRVEDKPDAVVFVDGHNDVHWISQGVEVPVYTYRADKAWEHLRRQFTFEAEWITINPSFPLARVWNFLRYIGVLQVPDFDDAWQFYRDRPADPVSRVVSVYRANRQMARAIADHLGIQAWFFLQPVYWYGPNAPADAKAPSGVSAEIAQSAYKSMIDEANSGKIRGFHTLHTALDSVKKGYVDRAHYSDLGNQVLASAMAEVMVREKRKH